MKKPATAKNLGKWENNWNILQVQTVKLPFKMYMPQFYIQLVYKAPLFITLKIRIWVSNIKKHDL